MAQSDERVSFARGKESTLPTEKKAGAVLVATDTGAVWVDDSDTVRVPLKDPSKLPLSGGTMTGDIDMGDNNITTSHTPTGDTDVVTKKYLDDTTINYTGEDPISVDDGVIKHKSFNSQSGGPTENQTLEFGDSFEVPSIESDTHGHVTTVNEAKITIPKFPDNVDSATNAATADKLSTARTIDGVSFDGSTNITHFCVCDTTGNTQAKTVECDNFVQDVGAEVDVLFENTNTVANITLNVNSTVDGVVLYDGHAITEDNAGYIKADRVYRFVWDGSNYLVVGDIDVNTDTVFTAKEPIEISGTVISHQEIGSHHGGPFEDEDLQYGEAFTVPEVESDDWGHTYNITDRKLTLPEEPPQAIEAIEMILSNTANAFVMDENNNVILTQSTSSETIAMGLIANWNICRCDQVKQELRKEINKVDETLQSQLDENDSLLGNTDISSIEDGTLTGIVASMYEDVQDALLYKGSTTVSPDDFTSEDTGIYYYEDYDIFGDGDSLSGYLFVIANDDTILEIIYTDSDEPIELRFYDKDDESWEDWKSASSKSVIDNIENEIKEIEDNYLKLSGGTLTGSLNINTDNNSGIHYTQTNDSGSAEIDVEQTWSGHTISLHIGSGGANRGIYDNTTDHDGWIVYKDSDDAIHLGASTVGSSTKPIYLSSGIPTASSSTVGSSSLPVYLNSGTITSISSLSLSGNITSTGGYITSGNYFRAPNNTGLYIADATDGTYRTAISLSSSNVYNIATGSVTNTINIGQSSYTTTLALRASNVTVSNTMTANGRITVNTTNTTGIAYTQTGTSGDALISVTQSWSDYEVRLGIGSGGVNRGVYDVTPNSPGTGYSGWILYRSQNSDAWEQCIVGIPNSYSNNAYLVIREDFLCIPSGEYGWYLGNSGHRWERIYSVNSSIYTSDERDKENITDIDEKYENLFMRLKPVNYMWKNFRKDDNHDRIHCGLIAQDIEKTCEEVGLTSKEFAALCHDDLEEEGFDGLTDRYGIAYEELHGLEIHMIQKNANTIEDLKNQLDVANEKISSLEKQFAS